ncbi:unnamed protein product [Arabis nemorensis]|uniref:Uncharacterized protein n=1 Tax=Arabis nemorensis TaxID=586526 RepID=A0A565BU45_9BRAS|nr:unnamed protein product [Arabis nemorensis]
MVQMPRYSYELMIGQVDESGLSRQVSRREQTVQIPQCGYELMIRQVDENRLSRQVSEKKRFKCLSPVMSS